MGQFAFALIFFGVFIVFGLVTAQRARARRKAWETFAAKSELDVAFGGGPKRPMALDGQRGGQPVHVVVERRGRGKQRRYFTVFRSLVVPELTLGLSLRREGFFERIAGAVDVQLGVPELDRAWRIQANDREGARRLLLMPRVSAALLGLTRTGEGFISGSEVVLERRGIASSEAELSLGLDLVAGVAAALQGAAAELAAVAPDASELDFG